MSETEDREYVEHVDVHPDVHRATEADEAKVLSALYGPPDENGIYGAPGAIEGLEPEDWS